MNSFKFYFKFKNLFINLMEISFNINFIDDSEIWLNIWKILKEQLHLHYTLIKLKDIINSKRSLLNLNIKMISNLTYMDLDF